MDYWNILLPIAYISICLIDYSSSLVCHYCYAADWKSDCKLNTKTCPDEHVCFSEKNTVILENNRKFVQYRMGCEHFSLCLDRVMRGDRLYGYTITNRTCCCQSLCEEADGVGKGQYFHCPAAWRGKDKDTVNNGISMDPNTFYCGLYCIATWITLFS